MSQMKELPLAIEIPFQDPCGLFERFSGESWAIFLDSAKQEGSLGRYSFIALSPFLTLSGACAENPFLSLREKLKKFELGLPFIRNP